MELQNARGTKDYLPEEMIALNEIMSKLKVYFESAGFNPITTPAIERVEILSAKYAGGAEILKETFQFEDQGKRKLGLRYDLTVPFSRIIGQNPQLKFPFKRYQMEKVYRDGPVGPGRYREFWQCDIDVVGAKSMKAEAELLSIVQQFFSSYDFQINVMINNRKIMNSILDNFNVDNKGPVILVLDKFYKLKKEELVKELLDLGYYKDESEKMIDYFEKLTKGTNEEIILECEKLIKTDEGKLGIAELKEVFNLSSAYGVTCLKFNPMLARGLSYYTGTVFETIIQNNAITSSVCAGGRFDKMIGDFLESKEEYPAVGISFGVSRIFDALVAAEKIKTIKTVTKILVISLNEDKTAIKTVSALRKNGINAEIDIVGRTIRKNLDYANVMGIPFAAIIGENEAKSGKLMLKNLITGEQKEVTVDEASAIIKG
jgi:histidyl-tRNA synthetase